MLMLATTNMFRIIYIIYFGTFLGMFASAESPTIIGVSEDHTGCFHNGTLFANGSMVPTMEPCLSCRCNVNTLVCSLRVCPEMPVPPPRGCILVQKKSGCCPYLSCTKFHTTYDGPNRRIVAYLDHYERETIDRVVNDNVLQKRSDDSDLDGSGDICIVNGTVYKSGSAMGSSSLCSYCYCIGGIQKCVKPKCMLNMEGCEPIFVDSTCCPVRYDCSGKNAGIVKASRSQIRSGNKHYLRVIGRTYNQKSRGCIINSTFYHEGQKLPADPDKYCDICFCIHGTRQCAPKKCAPPLKNCIPVVPKGQCCPSSYDCNNTREPGRQFDLFSLLFGSEGENNGSTTSLPAPPPTVSEFSNSGGSTKTTTERSLFDAIREGLQFIDNENTVGDVLKKWTIVNDTTSNTSASTTEESFLDKLDEEEDDDLGLFDILLGNDKKKGSVKKNATKGYEDEDSDEVEKEQSDEAMEMEKMKEANETEVMTMSPVSTTEEVTSTDNPASTIENRSTDDEDDYLYSSTAEDREVSTEIDEESTEVEQEDENDGELENETSTTTEAEYDESSSAQTDDETSTTIEIQSNTEAESKNDPNVILASSSLSPDNDSEVNSTVEEFVSTTSSPIVNHKVQTTQSVGGDFFSALFSGLTKILEPKLNKTKTSAMLNTTKTPTVEGDNHITSAIANSTNEASVVATTSSDDSDHSSQSSDPSSPRPHLLTPMPTGKPIIIKTNPSILESDYNSDYSEPTLPPSLPNLKIIPFLPTDAVKPDRNHMNYDYYGKMKPTPELPSITEKHDNWDPSGVGPKSSIAKIDYDMSYDHTPSYPSITEPYDETAGEHPKYEFSSFEYPDSSAENIKENFDVPMVAEGFDKFVKTEPSTVNRFSPPSKTEGGFVPKDPLAEQFYYDSYHTTKFPIELTTGAPNVLTTVNVSLTSITTPDPLMDVIKTELPPSLSSLMEDKEKLLASGVPAAFLASAESHADDSDFEKHIISITTDASYNFTSEYKDAKDDIIDPSSNFTISFFETGNISTTTIQPVVSEYNGTTHISVISGVTTNTTGPKENVTANGFDFGGTLESVLDLFFKDVEKNGSFEGITIPPFRTLPPDSAKYELIKTYKPGTAPADLDTSDSVEDLSILKDALLTDFRPKDNEKYMPKDKNPTKKPSSAEEMPSDSPTGSLSEPFNKLPFMKPSFPVKPSPEYHYNPLNADLDLMLPNPDDMEMRTIFNVEGSKVISNDPIIAQTDSYVVNPVDINMLKQHQSGGGAQVFTKPDPSNSINDPAGILKLAGCNIYGRMYRVGKIISELSGPCLECKCTEVGVNCTPLSC